MSNINFGNAFDLSALKKPAQNVEPIPGLEATIESLPKVLMPLSNTKPVVLVCWSERFPESLETLNALGKINREDQGSWQIATVEIEKQPQVAQALQTRVVPYVLAIIKEQVMPLFENQLSESQLRTAIDKVLALAAEKGIGEAPIERSEPEEDEAMLALQKGDIEAAIVAFEKLVNRKPNDAMAKSGLAQIQLLKRTQGLNASDVIAKAGSEPLNVAAQISCADIEISNGKIDSAFNRLLNCIRSLAGEDKNRAKEHLLTLFSLVDPTDPRLIQARKELASSLF